MKLSEITSAFNGVLRGIDVAFESVSIDTRTLKSGALFFALSGEKVNGHDFLAQAKAQGAVAAVIEQPVDVADFPTIQVKDARIALGQLARLYRDRFAGPVIAITGSCGKTTTRMLIAAIMSQSHTVLSTQGNFNNEIGLPLTLCALTDQHDCIVLEMGARHPGDIDYLTQIARPTVAVITNAAPVHLEGLGSLQGVAATKGEIFQRLDQTGIALINADDPFHQQWSSINTHCQTRYFGCNPSAEINARDIQSDTTGYSQFTLTTPTETGNIKLPLIGEYNILNALAAAAVATALHVPLAQIQHGLAQAKPVENRMIKRLTPAGVHLLDDTYNANPIAMQMALNVLAQHPGETILVMGDMGELGEQAVHYHQQVGEQAKALGITHVYTHGALARLAARSFGVMGSHFDSSEALMQKLKQVKSGTCLLIKGSRSAHMEQFVTSLMT